MELLLLDHNFEEIGMIDNFVSLQWIRKYYDVGQFILSCSTEYFRLLDEATYIFIKHKELAMINEIKMEISSDNNYSLSVLGSFIEAILDDRVIVGEHVFNGSHEEIARNLLTNNFINPSDANRKISNLSLGVFKNIGHSTSLEIKSKSIGKSLYTFLKEHELSQRITFDYMTNKLIYEIYQGLNRTDNQSLNSWALFSDELEITSNSSYSKDVSTFKNFAYVIYKDDLVSAVDCVGNSNRRIEMVVNSNEVIDVAKNKAKQELDKYKIIELFNASVNSNDNLMYLRDYDLGDLVTCISSQIGKMANKRITEINEVYEDGNVTINPKFGDDYITISKFIEREVGKWEVAFLIQIS